MKKTNALKIRQSLGKVLRELNRDGEPILVEKDRKPAAVLISLEDYQRRFADKEGDSLRGELIAMIKSAKLSVPKGKSAVELVREGRA